MKVRSTGPHRTGAPTVFIDRSLTSKKLLDRLRTDLAVQNLGVIICAHKEIFPHYDHLPEKDDTEWLEYVGKKGWIVLSHDIGIQYNEIEKRAVKHARVRLYALVGKNQSTDQMAGIVIYNLRRILNHARSHKPPYIIRFYKSSPLRPIKI